MDSVMDILSVVVEYVSGLFSSIVEFFSGADMDSLLGDLGMIVEGIDLEILGETFGAFGDILKDLFAGIIG